MSKRMIALFLSVLVLCSMMVPLSAQAAPNEQIEELIMVGDTGLQYMREAVDSEILFDGDTKQHHWVGYSATPLPDVDRHIGLSSAGCPSCSGTFDSELATKQAVIVWMGEKYTDIRIPGYAEWFDNDWLGRDSSSLPSSDAEYSGIALGRALAGYDYYILEEHTTPTEGGIPADQVANKYPDEPLAQAHAPVETGHYEDVLDDDGNVVGSTWVTDYWTYWVEVLVHKTGYAEIWKQKDCLVYVASLGPKSKSTNLPQRNATNAPVQEFNMALKSTAVGLTFIDIFNEVLDHNPYYRGNLDADSGTFYDADTLQYIFHLLWNTVLEANPNEKPPEPLDFSLYALSNSLTAYLNNVLSPNASGSYASDHEILTQSVGAGNAGAFLGYGDESYGFVPFITAELSGTSSTLDYSALIGQSAGDDLYLYARYGYLLNDLGLDSTGSVQVGGLSRMLPGSLLYLLFLLCSAISMAFSAVFAVMKFLNPFQFLAGASTLSTEWKNVITNGGSLNIPGGATVEGFVLDMMDAIGQFYDFFNNMGTAVMLPLFLVLTVSGILLFRENDGRGRSQLSRKTGPKLKKLIVRFAFIAIGVPLIGVSYTNVLNSLAGISLTGNSASAQIVAATFVDFEAWAKEYRLAPIDETQVDPATGRTEHWTTVLESEGADSENGALSGQASEDSYTGLRKTAVAINKASGSIDDIDMSMYTDAELESAAGWAGQNMAIIAEMTPLEVILNDKAAIEQGLELLRSYLSGSFYRAADWDSDALSEFKANHTAHDEIGSLAADDDGSVDNTGTLYELFDNTNEMADWTGRDAAANTEIFEGKDVNGSNTWSHFDLFANGALNTTVTGATAGTSDVVYGSTPGVHAGLTHDATCLCSKIGLSTLSLYNYLSTSFRDSQMVVYSNMDAGSMLSREAHYAVNMIGSGATRVLFGLNCFALLGCSAILGFCYAVGLMIRSVKRTFRVLLAIPGAMLGALSSIVQFLVCTFMLILEMAGTMTLYVVVTEVMMMFVSALDGPLQNALSSSLVTGGTLAAIGSVDPGIFTGSVSYFLGLGVVTVSILVFDVIAVLVSPKVVRVLACGMDFVYFKFVYKPQVLRSMQKKKKKVSVSELKMKTVTA